MNVISACYVCELCIKQIVRRRPVCVAMVTFMRSTLRFGSHTRFFRKTSLNCNRVASFSVALSLRDLSSVQPTHIYNPKIDPNVVQGCLQKSWQLVLMWDYPPLKKSFEKYANEAKFMIMSSAHINRNPRLERILSRKAISKTARSRKWKSNNIIFNNHILPLMYKHTQEQETTSKPNCRNIYSVINGEPLPLWTTMVKFELG